MQFSDRRNFTRWIIIVISFVIISLILWNTYTFFQIFKNEERKKMEHWAEAVKTLKNADENTDIELPLKIIQNASIPIMQIEHDSISNSVNIDEEIRKNKSKSAAFLKKLLT